MSLIQVRPSPVAALPQVMQFFAAAIRYQQARGHQQWPQFAPALIAAEMAEGRHWTVSEGGLVLGCFSVQYNDPVIWEERDADPAVYLHRIVVNPRHKGRRLMGIIRGWALQHARQQGRRYVRMDTWGHNSGLREYYIACGFTFIGHKQLRAEGQPAAHYGGNYLSLFQNEV